LKELIMKKSLIVASLLSLFAAASFAQTPAESASAPAAKASAPAKSGKHHKASHKAKHAAAAASAASK
jgi:hypothetical protein